MRCRTYGLLFVMAAASCRSRASTSARSVPPLGASDGQGRSSTQSVPPVPAEGCPATQSRAQRGPGTLHDVHVTGNETWTPEGSPHRLPAGITIEAGASLTIVPCTLVTVGAGQAIDVGADGALFAMGERTHPVAFESEGTEPHAGAWIGLRFDARARPTSRLAWVQIADGGADTHGPAPTACVVDAMPDLDLEHVTFSHCRGFAISFVGTGTFATTSESLTLGDRDTTFRSAVSFDRPDADTRLPRDSFLAP